MSDSRHTPGCKAGDIDGECPCERDLDKLAEGTGFSLPGRSRLSVMRHECPDGHEVAALVAVRCQHEGCRCEVAYEPVSVGMRLHEQLEGAVSQDVIRSALDEAATHPGVGDAAAAILFLRGRLLDAIGGQ